MTIAEITQTAQFIVGQNGKPTAIVLSIPMWEKILALLEDKEDVKIIKRRLRHWRNKQGWTSWDKFIEDV